MTFRRSHTEEEKANVKAKHIAIARAKFDSGQLRDRRAIAKHLADIRGYACCECGISEWNKKPLTLQVNHRDGNASNNDPKNLELICPNCHSQTETYGAKNKGNGRKARGLPLH